MVWVDSFGQILFFENNFINQFIGVIPCVTNYSFLVLANPPNLGFFFRRSSSTSDLKSMLFSYNTLKQVTVTAMALGTSPFFLNDLMFLSLTLMRSHNLGKHNANNSNVASLSFYELPFGVK